MTEIASTIPQKRQDDRNYEDGLIQLNLKHPTRGDAQSRYATSALAEEFLEENRHLIDTKQDANLSTAQFKGAAGASQSINQRYTNTVSSSEVDDESQLTDSYIQTSQFQSTNHKSNYNETREQQQQALTESVPPIDIRFE